MREAVIVDAVRTPLGRGKQTGALYPVHAVDLAAKALGALAERSGVDPALVEDVIMGCVSQVGEQGLNVGRNAALAAGFPETVVGTTVDRQCGSSQQSLHFAAQGVIAGAYDVVIAAGVESMCRLAKLMSLKPAFKDDGVITAGNSSQLTDGAAAVLVMEKQKAIDLGLRPRARFHTFALGGVDPVIMLTGPIPATHNAFKRSGLTI